MSEQPLAISQLNDFIFFPVSIFFSLIEMGYKVNELRLYSKDDNKIHAVYIFNLSNSCKVEKYGYARNEDTDLLIVK